MIFIFCITYPNDFKNKNPKKQQLTQIATNSDSVARGIDVISQQGADKAEDADDEGREAGHKEQSLDKRDFAAGRARRSLGWLCC